METTPKSESGREYVLGHEEDETRRLIRQAEGQDVQLRSLLEDAGLQPGMKVLDVGSGAGDVAFTAARLVSPGGSIVGVDVNGPLLETARQRASAVGLNNVSFIEADILTADLPIDFDAAIGRLVLIYLPDLTEAVATVASHVRPGGVIAFAELDFNASRGLRESHPSSFIRKYGDWFQEVNRRAGTNLSAGLGLHRAFIEAGLGAPSLSAFVGRPGVTVNDFAGAVARIRSALPMMERYGIATAAEVDPDTLAERIAAEVQRTGIPTFADGLLVTAWARKPA